VVARRCALLAAVVLSFAHFASFEIERSPIIRDARFYTYFSSRVALGDVPYRDFFDNKTPLSIYAGAALYRAGRALGAEPILAIRAGNLALAACGGLLLLALLRRLAGGRAVPALLGLVLYCAFPLLGWLPAVGVLPKLWMAIAATAMASCVRRRRFASAGAFGTLAFLDWQVGGLALLGALAAAVVERRARLRSAGAVLLGAAAVAVPFLVYFAAVGGLRAAASQTLSTMFARGAALAGSGAPASRLGAAERILHIWSEVRIGCQGHEWIFVLSALGMLVLPIWLLRWRRGPRFGTGVALAVHHYGIVAFSLFDFQSLGDLFVLLHSVAFFGAVLLAELCRRLGAFARRRRGLAEAALLAVCTAVSLPSVLRTELRIPAPNVSPTTTIDDQKEVARRLLEAERDSRIAVIGPAEVLFLTETRSATPFVYWNEVTYRYYRRSRYEPPGAPLQRELAAAGADLVVLDRTALREPGDRPLASKNGAYAVTIRRLR
jgi:hypothetical protein